MAVVAFPKRNMRGWNPDGKTTKGRLSHDRERYIHSSKSLRTEEKSRCFSIPKTNCQFHNQSGVPARAMRCVCSCFWNVFWNIPPIRRVKRKLYNSAKSDEAPVRMIVSMTAAILCWDRIHFKTFASTSFSQRYTLLISIITIHNFRINIISV